MWVYGQQLEQQKPNWYFSVGFLFTLHYLNSYISIKSIIFQPHHSETIKYIDIDKYVDIDIYTEITWTFFLAMAQNEYTQRENWGSLIHFENFHLFGEHDW